MESKTRIGRPLDPSNMAPPSSTLFTHSLKQLPSLSKGSYSTVTGAGARAFDGSSTLGFGAFSPLTGVETVKSGFGRSLTLRNRDWQHSDWLRLRTEQYARCTLYGGVGKCEGSLAGWKCEISLWLI